MKKTGLPKDRRLRADGFIIRAQATIGTDGFFVRAGFANSCAAHATATAARYARQPRLFCTDTHHPYKTNGVFGINGMLRPLTAPEVIFEMRP
jgi:hypothetical protein